MREDTPVKVSLLELLAKESRRYSEIVRELDRPDKTVYVTLNAFTDQKLVAKNDKEGKYELTEEGRQELERVKFVRVAGEEDDLRIIQNTRMAIALGRCYDILSELRFLTAREFRKISIEDRQKIRDKELVIRNLLLKYNPSVRKEDLIKDEEEEVKIGLQELLTGGFWWGKRLIKYGLTQRYLHLVNLAQELSDGPVKDEIRDALELIRQVGGKLDERLKAMTPIEAT
jgi:DNA-binding PadR family transcriptional regulator